MKNLLLMKGLLISFLILWLVAPAFSTTWTITNSGSTFSPATLTISLGDTVKFVLSGTHNAVEVSEVTWNANGTTALAGGFSTPFGGGSVLPAKLGTGTHWYVCTNHAGFGMKGKIIVEGCSVPAQPNPINGNSSICESSSETYSIEPVEGANDYTWTLPNGWTGSSTSESIQVTANTNGGNITVTANNACGASSAQTLSISTQSIPAQPENIIGNNMICAGASRTYSITAVNQADTYTWTLPEGWTGSSTTNSLTATSNETGGTLSVTANNECGSSSPQILAISIQGLPSAPDTILGNTIICVGSSETYQVSPVQGATNYTWTLPNGWSGSSSSESIQVTANTIGGDISVTANNECGSSPTQTLAISMKNVPTQPLNILGNDSICAGSTNTYFIPPVEGAISYSWTLPEGWEGDSNSDSITLSPNNQSGNLLVTANNECGASVMQVLSISVQNVPNQPEAINGPVLICANSVYIYQIDSIEGAQSYIWLLPNGWTGISTSNSITATCNESGGNIEVKALNECGESLSQSLSISITGGAPVQPSLISGSSAVCFQSTQEYRVESIENASDYEWVLPASWSGSSTSNTITAVVGASGGEISVKAINGCGESSAQTLGIEVNDVPASPTAIQGPTSVCVNSNYEFSVAEVNNTDTYTWQLPSEWIGTSTSNSISVTTSSSGGDISVVANNECGASTAQLLSVSVNVVEAAITSSGATLTANLEGAQYQWINCLNENAILEGEISQSFTATSSGSYAVVVNRNGCIDTSACEEVVILQAQEVSLGADDVRIYPNPSQGQLHLEVLASSSELFDLEIFNTQGTKVHSVAASSIPSKLTIDMSTYPKGIYLLNLRTGSKISVRKVVIE